MLSVKEMIAAVENPELDRMRHMVDMEVQTFAGKLAFEYNDRIRRTEEPPGMKLKCVLAKNIRLKTAPGFLRWVMAEKKYH